MNTQASLLHSAHVTVHASNPHEAHASITREAFIGFYQCLSRTLDALNRQVTDLLKQYRVSEPQYNVLRILQASAAEPETISCKGIADRLITRDPDLTRLLDRLEGQGLIERRRGAADRRMVQVMLSPAGQAVLNVLEEPLAHLYARQAACLSSEGFDALLEKLDVIRSCLEKNAGLSRWPKSSLPSIST
jgi:DNA-binding MarR family transcriptional regulator